MTKSRAKIVFKESGSCDCCRSFGWELHSDEYDEWRYFGSSGWKTMDAAVEDAKMCKRLMSEAEIEVQE